MGKGVSTPFRLEFLSSRQTELAARVNVSATWMRRPFTVKSHNVRTSLRFLRFSEKFVTATIVVSSHSSGVVLTGGFVAAIHVNRRQLLRLQRYVVSCCLYTAGKTAFID